MRHAVVYIPQSGVIAAVWPEGDPRLEGTYGLLTVIKEMDEAKAEACRRGEWVMKGGKLAPVKAVADERPEVPE